MSELSACPETAALPNGFELTELSPHFLQDPHPILDRLRQEAPRHIHAHAHFPQAPTGLYLTRIEDVRAIFSDATYQRDPRKTPLGSLARSFAPPAMLDPAPHGNLLYMDGAEHRRVRSLVSRAFTPKSIATKRGEIEAIAARLLEEAAAKPDFDAIAEFAAPYPIYVIGDMLGFSRADMPQFRAWSEDLIFVFNPLRSPDEDRRQMAAFAGLDAYFAEQIARRRRQPSEDLLSAIIHTQDGGDTLTDPEVSSLLLLLLLAGNLTTADVIGNGLHALITHPDEWAALVVDPDLAVPATEELLRYGPPVAIAARYVPEDRDILGCPVKKGAAVVVSLLGANRDPEAFEDPHAFRIRRGRRDHAAFGGGAHACLGAPLARLEIEIALRLLASRYPRLRLAAPAVRDRPTIGFVGFRSLRLSLT
ncbi:cytochrome P450 [Hyphomonas sp.]|uniref:cytochrome P450 n=1 Tax=Hyphomonas sp. TaxID=87 RepID=UPI0025BFD185|nr:cytochrome P450 [Hyphomonas sp.]MBI1400090.1 cytochrome P450 [Hyphomonas sp.]